MFSTNKLAYLRNVWELTLNFRPLTDSSIVQGTLRKWKANSHRLITSWTFYPLAHLLWLAKVCQSLSNMNQSDAQRFHGLPMVSRAPLELWAEHLSYYHIRAGCQRFVEPHVRPFQQTYSLSMVLSWSAGHKHRIMNTVLVFVGSSCFLYCLNMEGSARSRKGWQRGKLVVGIEPVTMSLKWLHADHLNIFDPEI